MLKRRFPAVDYMGASHDIQTRHWVLEALVALHNLCIDYGDKALEQIGDDSLDDSDDKELPAILDAFPGHLDYREELPEGGWGGGHESEYWLKREGDHQHERLREESHWHARS